MAWMLPQNNEGAVRRPSAIARVRLAGWSARVMLLCVAASVICGQDATAPFHKRMEWQGYTADHPISGRWGLHFDGSWREMSRSEWQQWQIRPGVNYALSENTDLSVAYSYFKAHPAGLEWDVKSFPEHRTHQQINAQQPAGRLRLQHRFRAEQRFFGSEFERKGLDAGWMQHRLRYLFGGRIPLARSNESCHSCYARLYNEVMLRVKNSGASHFEQNRTFAGLGFRPAPDWNIESGIFYQRLQPILGGPLEHNLVLHTTVSTNTSLLRLFGR
ncbi:MAG: DUF2490 domain-containing protein [Bryobacterales bacterium]|nr:DUF2490 domain-containing protein [Bryobacterales bacterium]